MIRNAVLALTLVTLLAGCTMLYTREYVAEAPEQMSPKEAEEVFRAFREYLIAKGLKAEPHGAAADSNSVVVFRIAGSNFGFALRRDWEDLLEISRSGEIGIRLRLLRIIHSPEDFSEEYLKRFVNQTEEFLRDATKKTIRLKLVPGA